MKVINTDDDYFVVSKIGNGGFGTAYKAINKSTGRIVTIKMTHFNESDFFQKHFSKLQSINSKNVISIVDFFQDKKTKQVFIVYPYLEFELGKLLRYQPKMFLDYTLLSYISHQILLGIEDLHSNGIAHLDIKPGNIFLTKEWDIKIGDLESSKAFGSKNDSGISFTCSYISPEILQGKKDIQNKIDLFSFGLILYELIKGKPLLNTDNSKNALKCIQSKLSSQNIDAFLSKKINKKKIPEFSKKQCNSIKSLLVDLLKINPDERIDAKTALTYPFILYYSTQNINFPIISISESYEKPTNKNFKKSFSDDIRFLKPMPIVPTPII